MIGFQWSPTPPAQRHASRGNPLGPEPSATESLLAYQGRREQQGNWRSLDVRNGSKAANPARLIYRDPKPVIIVLIVRKVINMSSQAEKYFT
jgi:hypothetical protein